MADPSNKHGRVVYLNGTSSSGKSSLARALVDLSDEAFTYLALDHLGGELHRYAARLAHSGNHVIIDNVAAFFGAKYCDDFAESFDLLADLSVILVRVDCNLEELERREKERGDRMIGLARTQFDTVHAHGQYDLVVDTGNDSARDCARQILDFIAGSCTLGAYDRLGKIYESEVGRLHELVQTYHRAHTEKNPVLAAECVAGTFMRMGSGRPSDPGSWGAGQFLTRDAFRLSLEESFANDSQKYTCEVKFLRTAIQGGNATLVTRETGSMKEPDGKVSASWEGTQNVYYLTRGEDGPRIAAMLLGIA